MLLNEELVVGGERALLMADGDRALSKYLQVMKRMILSRFGFYYLSVLKFVFMIVVGDN